MGTVFKSLKKDKDALKHALKGVRSEAKSFEFMMIFSTFLHEITLVGTSSYSKHLYKTLFFVFYSTSLNVINMLQVCLLVVKMKLLLVQWLIYGNVCVSNI